MAYRFVGVGNAVEVAAGNLTLVEPAGVQQGDLLVACISYRSNAAFAAPSGWTAITSQNTGNTTAAATTSIGSGFMAFIVRGSSAPVLTFTRTAGDVALGRIVAYRNTWAGGSPLVASTSTTLAAAATAVSAPGLTTANAEDLIVFALCGARNITASAFRATDPATSSGTNSGQTADPIVGTWQERVDSGTATGGDCALAIADAERAIGGATGNLLCTASASARHVVLAAAFRSEPVKAASIPNFSISPALGAPAISLGGRMDFLIPNFQLTPIVGSPVLIVVPSVYPITLRIKRL